MLFYCNKCIGSSVKKKGEPDKDTLKNSIVQEAEVMCLTTLDAKFSLPVGVNHLTKGLTALDTLDSIKNEIPEICLDHLEQSRTDNISIPTNCSSYCTNCIELGTVCDASSGKGHIVIEPAL